MHITDVVCFGYWRSEILQMRHHGIFIHYTYTYTYITLTYTYITLHRH